MSLTLLEMKRRAGKILQIYSTAGGWLTNRGVAEVDIEEIANDTYRNDIFPLFAPHNPSDFRRVGYADNWVANGTVSASSTASTLVATTAIFNASMVGLTVNNSTDSVSAVITAFTSTTTVTVDVVIGDTWDGNSIFVLGKEFSFGGDGNDIWMIETVAAKYSDTATYKTVFSKGLKHDIYQQGNESGSDGYPVFYTTNLTVNGIDVLGIGIEPRFKSKISQAFEINYIQLPAAMTDASTLRIPHLDLALIDAMVSRGYDLKQDSKRAQMWWDRYEKKRMDAFIRYAPNSFNPTMGTALPRHISAIARRTR